MEEKMTRTIIREHIFKILFRAEFYEQSDFEEQVRLYLEENKDISEKDSEYIYSKVNAVFNMVSQIDEAIDKVSEGWPTTRIGKAELSILRLALYEIKYDDEIPVNVAINEAVELAKKYGADSAPSFVNGILAKLIN